MVHFVMMCIIQTSPKTICPIENRHAVLRDSGSNVICVAYSVAA